MSFCVTISGVDDAIGKMIYDQWKYHRGVYAQISTIDDEPMMPCRCGKSAENFLNNPCMDGIKVIIGCPPYSMCRMKPEEDDTEEWAMTEYEFREWYFTHSHKETMAFYNFFMEDNGDFRKISPQIVEKELYKLWKKDPQYFTDVVLNFDFEEDVEEYTYKR